MPLSGGMPDQLPSAAVFGPKVMIADEYPNRARR